MGRGKSGYTTNNTSQSQQNKPQPKLSSSQQPIASLDDAKTISDLNQYMKVNYNVTFESALKACDFELMKEAAEDFENLLHEFKQVLALGTFKKLTTGEKDPTAYASAWPDGNIFVNLDKYKNGAFVAQRYAANLRDGLHPVGTLPRDILVHEFGHQLESALIWKSLASNPNPCYDVVKQWNSCTQARKVVNEALMNLKSSLGNQISFKGAMASVSRYALDNRSETLAECVADYYRNRNNAKPLSQEVWKILKRELG